MQRLFLCVIGVICLTFASGCCGCCGPRGGGACGGGCASYPSYQGAYAAPMIGAAPGGCSSCGY